MALITFYRVKFQGHFALVAAFLGCSLVDYCLSENKCRKWNTVL